MERTTLRGADRAHRIAALRERLLKLRRYL